MTIRLLLVDDHRLVREGLRRILDAAHEMDVVAEARTAGQALDIARRQRTDVVITDLTLPGLSGIGLVRRFKVEFPVLPLLVLTMHADARHAVRVFRAGAEGYLTKDRATDELAAAVHSLAAGGVYLSSALAERVAAELGGPPDAPSRSHLTDRELDVFRLMAAGRRPADIAEELHLPAKTVGTDQGHVLEKLRLQHSAASG